MEEDIQDFIDVRSIEPKFRHAQIFEKFDSLEIGAQFMLLNDHDPKPLYYQILAERGNIFEWQYVESGPEVWQILLKKKEMNNSETVGEIAAKDIRKAQVFKKYGIDFCCGGKKFLKQVCDEKSLDITMIENDLDQLINQKESLNFNKLKLDFLCDYIVNTHHQYVKETLPLISELSTKVSTKHGEWNPELIEINKCVQNIYSEMMLHMQKEEKILFPFIKRFIEDPDLSTEGFSINEPIAMMEMEHETVGDLFKEIEVLSNKYSVPENACNSFVLLYTSIQDFYDDLTIHIHLENNILFPKSLALLNKN